MSDWREFRIGDEWYTADQAKVELERLGRQRDLARKADQEILLDQVRRECLNDHEFRLLLKALVDDPSRR